MGADAVRNGGLVTVGTGYERRKTLNLVGSSIALAAGGKFTFW